MGRLGFLVEMGTEGSGCGREGVGREGLVDGLAFPVLCLIWRCLSGLCGYQSVEEGNFREHVCLGPNACGYRLLDLLYSARGKKVCD